jgi:uncharacterized protein (DUF362 family)/NAD-dependent dihydropyrimidine dehydrogenase PreA subunit
MASKVALVRCEGYDEDLAHAAVGRALDLLGGAASFAELGESIVLKPNLLVGSPADQHVTTHPSVFKAVAAHLQAAGAHLSYGDSPAFGRTESAARRAGLGDAIDELSLSLADFSDGREIQLEDAALVKTWFFANGALDADGIVSISKMKTHGLTRMTGAIKNQFGCIPGIRKGEFHARMTDVDLFSQMLVDLNRALPARLYVMDAIIAMEGNGPRSGDPRPMNVVLASADPVALDATMCRLANLDIELVGTCTHGEALGLGTASDIELVGDPIDEFIAEEFVVNRSAGSTTGTGNDGRASRFMRGYLIPKPVIDGNSCTACGTCVKMCPIDPKAVDWTTEAGAKDKKPPAHDYKLCTRCYCCQETCPEHAIKIVTPLLGRVVHRGSSS